jgi:predicted NBD/HSP70 family sugar kinase
MRPSTICGGKQVSAMYLIGEPARQGSVRRHNVALVVDAIAALPASRAAIAQATGLTRATVSSLVDDLVAQNIVSEGELISNGPGRPARPVSLNPGGPVAVGVEINVDYTCACVVDLTGAVRVSRRLELDNRQVSARRVESSACRLAAETVAEHARPTLGVGLALPGVVDDAGALVRAPNLPQLTGQRPGVAIGAAVGHGPAETENEANLGALACLHHEPDAGSDFVYVSGEIGVGAGLVVAGKLYRGANGFAGELGHVVVERDGPLCGCGGRGCLEQYAGLTAILAAADAADLAILEAALAAGDRPAIDAVERAADSLGVALSSLLNVMDLPQVVLGGVYARLFDRVRPSLMSQLSRRVISSRLGGGQVRRSALGADAAVRGAAGLVLERFLADPLSASAVN